MSKRPYQGKSLLQILFEYTKIDIYSECFIWQGKVDKDGYAIRSKDIRVAREVYEYFSGKKLHTLKPDHLCNNPICVNFLHLEAVTHGENIRRSHERNPKLRCIHGHKFTEENTYIDKRGRRSCKICRMKSWKMQLALKNPPIL